MCVTRIISPTDFFAQTVQQRNGLRRLEISMAETLSPNQPAIPAQLLVPGLCCGVFSDVSKTWRRSQVIRVERDVSVGPPYLVVDVYLIDTGFERRFPASALKPINEHLTTYLPLVFRVKLAHPYFEGIRWRAEDTEKFREMVDKRMMLVKFMTNVPPIFEVCILVSRLLRDLFSSISGRAGGFDPHLQCVLDARQEMYGQRTHAPMGSNQRRPGQSTVSGYGDRGKCLSVRYFEIPV